MNNAMSKRYIVGILEGYQAQEIADNYSKDPDCAAQEYFKETIFESEGSWQDMPVHHNFVNVIDDDWDLYYDYGADYYFAVNNKMHYKDGN